MESLVGKKNWEVPEGLVSSFLKRRTFDIPEFEGGNAPPLSRPILFVHGLGANYTSYGAKPAINVEGKGFSAERELVRAYKGGSAPDVIARKNKLDMSYDPNYPERGINTNGIYFWNAKSEDLMNPEYNESGASQARDIQLTIESMLDRHFGSAWKSDSTLKFDLVCHSQGCVSIRDMMHNNSVVVDKSLSNPLNHLNRILNINAPHQGSILATSPDDIRADYLEYWGVADFKEGLLSENMEGHGLLSGTIELDALGTATSVTVGAIVGGAAGSIFGPLGAGIGGALGAFIGGWFASEAEANFNLQGAYLGPYNYTWGIDYLFGSASGEDELEDFTDSIRSKVMEMEGAASHLSNNSPWLLSLNLGGPLRNGYPYLPNGKPVRMSIFSSQGLERLESEILFGLAEAINLKCGGNEDCDISSEYFISEGVNFAENKVNSFPLISAELDLSGDFLQILKDFRGQWLANSDIAVQKESQNFENSSTGRVRGAPGIGTYLEKARNYPFHILFNPHYPLKMVPHSSIKPINILGESTVDFAGATLAGLDIYCELSPSCKNDSTPLRLESNIGSAKVILTQNNSNFGFAKNQSVKSLELNGDFDLSPIVIDPSLHGMVLMNSTGRSLFTLGNNPDQGVYLSKNINGVFEPVTWLANPSKPSFISLIKSGTTITARVSHWDGRISDKVIGNQFVDDKYRIGVFGDESNLENVALAGSGIPSDPRTQEPPKAPGEGLVVFHKEGAPKKEGVSRPVITVVNHSNDEQKGIHLSYWFTVEDLTTPEIKTLLGDGFTYELIELGSRNYRIDIHAPDVVIPPKGRWPIEGLVLELSQSNSVPWFIRDDWSANLNVGLIRKNERVLLTDNSGEVLWGNKPNLKLLNKISENFNHEVTIESKENALWESNILKPVLKVLNKGVKPLSDFSVLYFVKIPPLTIPQNPHDYYTPNFDVSLEKLSEQNYAIRYRYVGEPILKSEEVETGEIGFSLKKWLAWPKEDNPSFISSNQWIENSKVAVVNSSGKIIAGSYPSTLESAQTPKPQIEDLKISFYDEGSHEENYLKPRFFVRNTGEGVVHSFELEYEFSDYVGEESLLDAVWYLPGCEVNLIKSFASKRKVEISCTNLILRPDETWPAENSSAIFGLHHKDWSPMIKPALTSMKVIKINE